MKQEILGYAEQMKDCARCGVRYAAAKIKTLELWELGLLQLGFVSLGAWLSAAFSKTMKKFKYLFFITFLASGIYFIWRIFCDTEA